MNINKALRRERRKRINKVHRGKKEYTRNEVVKRKIREQIKLKERQEEEYLKHEETANN